MSAQLLRAKWCIPPPPRMQLLRAPDVLALNAAEREKGPAKRQERQIQQSSGIPGLRQPPETRDDTDGFSNGSIWLSICLRQPMCSVCCRSIPSRSSLSRRG